MSAFDPAPLAQSVLKFVLAHREDQDTRGSRFSEEQIIGILKEQESGVPVADLCRKHEVSDASIYKWKAKYGGMEVSEAKRLRLLEEENAKLTRMLAEAILAGPLPLTFVVLVQASGVLIGRRCKMKASRSRQRYASCCLPEKCLVSIAAGGE